MSIKIAEYKFNNTLYDYIPVFNTEFTDFTYEDVVDGEVTTRTIYSDSLPNAIMFGYDQGATDWTNSLLEINYLDATNVTDMYAIFAFCQNLTYVNINNANIIANTSGMFYECQSLTTLVLNNWDTSNVTNMSHMFYGCESLTTLDVSNWDISNVTNTEYMFNNCELLTTLEMNNSDYDSVNEIIGALPTRTSESMGTLNVAGVDDISQVDTAAAESKYWNIIRNVRKGPTVLSKVYIGDKKISRIYIGDKRIF